MDRLSYWIYRLVGAVAGRLPLETLCRLGMAGGWCAYYLLPGYLAYLETKTGRRELSRKPACRA